MLFYTIGARGLKTTGKERKCLLARSAYQEASQNPIPEAYYLGTFWLTEDFKKHYETTGSTNEYDGICWSPWLWFDIDCKDNVEKAQLEVIKLADYFVSIGVEQNDLLIFLSGNKGFHLAVPFYGPSPSNDFNLKCKILAGQVVSRLGLECVDFTLYQKTRLFRCPNSRHEKTGLYKRLFELWEVRNKSLSELQEMAKSPKLFVVGDFKPMCEKLKAQWYSIEMDKDIKNEKTNNSVSKKADYYPPSRLNRNTIEFLRCGAEDGEREMACWKAAANISEMIREEKYEELVYSLLKDAAEDSGLKPSEIKHAIKRGFLDGMRLKV